MNKTRWADVTEAELAATGKVRRGSVSPAQPGAKLASGGTTLTQGKSKYRNVKTVVGTERFDSGREAAYWQGLLARQAAGEIKDLKRQVEFPLCAKNWRGEVVQISAYYADFTYVELNISGYPDGCERVIDAKGHRTQMYRLKKKWLELQDGIEILEV